MTTEADFSRKRRFSFAITLVYIFFGACEQVAIIPTISVYLFTLGVVEDAWTGLAISAYYASSSITGLLGGWLNDHYPNHTKSIVILGILFRIVGNLQYMLGINHWNLLCARIITGFSGVAGTALLAELGRITTRTERTMFLSITIAAFQVGILVGPLLQILLVVFNFQILGIKITLLNAPGLIMALVWTLHMAATASFFSNLTEEFNDVDMKRVYEKRYMLEIIETTNNEVCTPNVTKQDKGDVFMKYKNELLTKIFAFLMLLAFVLFFNQVSFQASILTYGQKYFGFSFWENTCVSSTIAFEAILVFVGVAFLGKCVRETTLQALGLFFMVTALIWLVIVLPQFENGNTTHTAYFLAGTLVNMFGNPIATAATVVLASKVLSSETQGLGQGIRRSVCFLALIIGSNWAHSAAPSPHLLLGFLLVMVTVTGIIFLGFYSSLRRSEENSPLDEPVKPQIQESNETAPLLESTENP